MERSEQQLTLRRQKSYDISFCLPHTQTSSFKITCFYFQDILYFDSTFTTFQKTRLFISHILLCVRL